MSAIIITDCTWSSCSHASPLFTCSHCAPCVPVPFKATSPLLCCLGIRFFFWHPFQLLLSFLLMQSNFSSNFNMDSRCMSSLAVGLQSVINLVILHSTLNPLSVYPHNRSKKNVLLGCNVACCFSAYPRKRSSLISAVHHLVSQNVYLLL